MGFRFRSGQAMLGRRTVWFARFSMLKRGRGGPAPDTITLETFSRNIPEA